MYTVYFYGLYTCNINCKLFCSSLYCDVFCVIYFCVTVALLSKAHRRGSNSPGILIYSQSGLPLSSIPVSWTSACALVYMKLSIYIYVRIYCMCEFLKLCMYISGTYIFNMNRSNKFLCTHNNYTHNYVYSYTKLCIIMCVSVSVGRGSRGGNGVD